MNFTGTYTYTHLPDIIEAITDNVSGGQMTCQAIFDRHVGVKQADHGQLAETAPTILWLVDFLKHFQASETHTQIFRHQTYTHMKKKTHTFNCSHT